ncbi:MAG: hypothetical protein AABZ80_11620 [Gemmatimonadota bacterium]|mgnify:FL=1
MNSARYVVVVALAFAAACVKDKPGADTTAAAPRGLPAPDTVKAAAVPEADSTKIMKAADTKGAATKGVPAGTKSPDSATMTKTSTKQPVIGRDSVRQGPILGIPTIKDTAKRRPPR